MGSKKRVHLSPAERKKFTRLKRIVSYSKQMLISSRHQFDVIEGFGKFYTSCKKSLAKLTDMYVKLLNM